jgi:lipopolysaccharide biosynthesis regulator YciM
MGLSALDAQEGHAESALDKLLQLERHSPQHLPLAAARLAELAKQTGRVADVRPVLQAADARGPSIDITQALASLDATGEQARQEYLTHLEREPSLVMATAWLEAEPEASRQAPAPVLRALQVASGPQRRYRCAACGFEAQRHFWQCPGCQTWDSYPARRVEEL